MNKIVTALHDLSSHTAVRGMSEIDSVLVGIQSAQDVCFNLAMFSGWHDNVDYSDKREVATKLCLVHSEISEALEGARKDLMDDHLIHRKAVEVELADAMIRILDLAGALKLDLSGAVIEKLAYNQQRTDHKREHRSAEGGKKF